MVLGSFTEFVGDSLPGIFVAVVAAWFSSYWAVRKFTAEKWWEKREAAYSELIEALHVKIRCLDELGMESYPDQYRRKPSEEERKVRGERNREADIMILRAEDVGAFWISREATEVLENLRKREKLDAERNPMWEVYEQDCEHHKNALSEIKNIAMKDLKVPNRWKSKRITGGFGLFRR